MTSWIEHAVRRWRLRMRGQAHQANQQMIAGRIPCEWQVRAVFMDLVKLNPIMEVVQGVLAVREFDKEVKG